MLKFQIFSSSGTDEAVKVYNRLAQKYQVGGLFHSTCWFAILCLFANKLCKIAASGKSNRWTPVHWNFHETFSTTYMTVDVCKNGIKTMEQIKRRWCYRSGALW